MNKPRLAESLRQFVERQTTMAVANLWDGDREDQRSTCLSTRQGEPALDEDCNREL